MYPHKEFSSKPDFRRSTGKMQLGRACIALNRAWHDRNLVFWLLLQCGSKIKHPLEGQSLHSHLQPTGKRWGRSAERERHTPA